MMVRKQYVESAKRAIGFTKKHLKALRIKPEIIRLKGVKSPGHRGYIYSGQPAVHHLSINIGPEAFPA